MPSLASTILQHDAASATLVEEALARQALHGGDLATNLLELNALSEQRLHQLQAEALGLPPAGHGALPRANKELRSWVPEEVARVHGCIPLEAGADELVVAVSSSLPEVVVTDLQAHCGRHVIQKAALAARIDEALARDYGMPLDRRFERLFAVLEGRPDPYPSVRPRGADQAPQPPNRFSTKGAALVQGAKSEPAPRSRHRGPYTAARAEADLLDATDRDTIIRAFFDFAAQYFEYAALFVVHGDIAEGWDAYGSGADSQRVNAIGVPLDLESILGRAWRTGRWQVAVLSFEGLDAALARDLRRTPGRTVAVVPVVLRERPVLLLYGDHGESDVELPQIGDLIAFAPLVSRALERLLRQRKRSQGGALPTITTQTSRASDKEEPPPLQPLSLPAAQQTTHVPGETNVKEAEVPRSPTSPALRSEPPPSEASDIEELPYLIERLLQGDRSSLQQVVGNGKASIAPLMFHFPGPVTRDSLPPPPLKASDCGIAMEALVRIGDASVPAVVGRTVDAQPQIRQWATLVLGEIPSPESVRAILARLGDREVAVRQAAAAALRQLLESESGQPLVERALRTMVEPGSDKSIRLTAFEYLAEIRHPFVVPLLLDALHDKDNDTARSAEWALGVVCRQTFGSDADAWGRWWKANRTRPRWEWLVDALAHHQPAVRRASSEELRALTRETFGYREDLPAEELCAAQERFRAWWADRETVTRP